MRRTFVASLLESRFGHFQRPPDRWVGKKDAIVPHDRKAQVLTKPMVREFVLVFVPLLPNRKRVLEPWFRVNDSFHKDLEPAETVCHRTEHGENRVFALK